jgi:hypothetical protein
MNPRKKKKRKKGHRSGKASRQPKKGRRYTPEQKTHVLTLVASGVPRTQAGDGIGATYETVRRWLNKAEANGTMPKVPMKGHVEGGSATGARSVEDNGQQESAVRSCHKIRWSFFSCMEDQIVI